MQLLFWFRYITGYEFNSDQWGMMKVERGQGIVFAAV